MGDGFLRKAIVGYQQAAESSRRGPLHGKVGVTCTPAKLNFRRNSAPFEGCSTHTIKGADCTHWGPFCTRCHTRIFSVLRIKGSADCRIPCASQHAKSPRWVAHSAIRVVIRAKPAKLP